MLNDTLLFDSEDEYRLTGTETSPNEIVAVAIERAGMVGNQGGGANETSGTRSWKLSLISQLDARGD
jgi:hypothetical protein